MVYVSGVNLCDPSFAASFFCLICAAVMGGEISFFVDQICKVTVSDWIIVESLYQSHIT